jgi:hypothetical protein
MGIAKRPVFTADMGRLVLSVAKPHGTGGSVNPRLQVADMGRLVLSVAKPDRTGGSVNPRLQVADMGTLVLSVAKPNRTRLHRRVSSAGCGPVKL